MQSELITAEQYKNIFCDLLRILRNQRGLSAREMSLELGQNVNYINLIENGKRLPSMQGFFSICEYMHISPAEFFSAGKTESETTDKHLHASFAKLTDKQKQILVDFIAEFSAG